MTRRNFWVWFLLPAIIAAACSPQAQARTDTPIPSKPTETQEALRSPAPEAAATKAGPAPIELTRLEPKVGGPFAETPVESWEPAPYSGPDYRLPITVDQVTNRFVLNGLTDEQLDFLLQHGFVVTHSQEPQFHSIRDAVSWSMGQPYYLSVDAAFHALHLAFDDLLKALEREWLQPRLIDLQTAVLRELISYRPVFSGTGIESDLEVSIAYMSVALGLLAPEQAIDPEVAPVVKAQIDQILAEGGMEKSILFPDFEDDYGAYRPVGHYAGDPLLEAYFRAMTWFGRVNFTFTDRSSSRLPLLVTLALRRVALGEGMAADAWSGIHEMLSFLIGPSDDPGPVELAELMDSVYGASPDPATLVDPVLWSEFLQASQDLPSPRINSLFVQSLADVESTKGWRFLGQRFTMDGFILQNLIFDKVQDKPNGERRFLPTGPDVMATLGSQAAFAVLENSGETAFPGYQDQMRKLQHIVSEQTQEQWQAGSYDAWLYAFLPVLEVKGEDYPEVMQGSAWAIREMNSCLGSWAELKHDTILYAKMPEGVGGGGPPCTSGPPPAYVEANPEAFYRLAYVASVIAQGLVERDVVTPGEYTWCMTDSLEGLTYCMQELGKRFASLGEIAARELTGEPITPSDFDLIQSCLGGEECMAMSMSRYGGGGLDPMPIVAAVAGAAPGVLEAATGYVDRMYVVVPINGSFFAAQGGVYSYYEFIQPREDRLTDEAWRERLDSGQAPDLPAWASGFVFEGGSPTNVTGFYVGAAYEVTDQGAGVGLRSGPGMAFSTIGALQGNSMVQIIDGPVQQDNLVWWQFEDCFSGETGWLFQDGRYLDYYSR